MNLRQLIVLWSIAFTVAGVSLIDGVGNGDIWRVIAIPAVVLGGTLIYSLGNDLPQQADASHGARNLVLGVLLICVIQVLQWRQLAGQLESVRANVRDSRADIQNLGATVTNVQGELSELKSDVEGTALR